MFIFLLFHLYSINYKIIINAIHHLYVTSMDAYKEGKEARLERRRAERHDQERDDASKE